MRFVVGMVVALDVVVAATVWARHHHRHHRLPAGAPAAPLARGWAGLDPPARCASALGLVAYPNRWPMLCRWREASDTVAGMAFPPPVGAPPWDHPRIEIYLAPDEARPEVAHAIAHELGHMRHTRDAPMARAWLAARGLPPDTVSAVWVEDYAEAFAAVFGPAVGEWDAPTARPTPAALESLRAQFFDE